MADLSFPVDFTEKTKLPAAGGGSGYPYQISASDLMRDFYYSALEAEDGWIETTGNSINTTRKLKLPALPQGEGIYLLNKNQWLDGYVEKEVSFCDNNYEVKGKILFKESQ
jgi:hypothetical protein